MPHSNRGVLSTRVRAAVDCQRRSASRGAVVVLVPALVLVGPGGGFRTVVARDALSLAERVGHAFGAVPSRRARGCFGRKGPLEAVIPRVAQAVAELRVRALRRIASSWTLAGDPAHTVGTRRARYDGASASECAIDAIVSAGHWQRLVAAQWTILARTCGAQELLGAGRCERTEIARGTKPTAGWLRQALCIPIATGSARCAQPLDAVVAGLADSLRVASGAVVVHLRVVLQAVDAQGIVALVHFGGCHGMGRAVDRRIAAGELSGAGAGEWANVAGCTRASLAKARAG